MGQTPIIEGNHAGAYIVDEVSVNQSRKTVVLTGGNFKAGTVLGMVSANEKYTQLAPAAADGTQDAIAILYENVDASTADKEAVVSYRSTSVNEAELVWPDAITAPQKTEAIRDLDNVHIVVL